MPLPTATRTVAGRVRAALIAVLVFASVLGVPSTVTAKTIREYQWYLGPLKVAQAQQLSRGAGVTVAVVDTGVDPSPPDLAGKVLPGTGFGEAAGTDGRRDFEPKLAHGTAMAGLIVGAGRGPTSVLGIAPDARILPVSIGKDFRDRDVVAGIRWAVDHGAKVINLSVGSVGAPRRVMVDAVRYALDKDVVLVASAGNAGTAVYNPASVPGVIAVSAVDKQTRLWPGSNRGPEIVVAAPGVEIVSPVPRSADPTGFGLSQGTSDASAIVSGVAALVRSRFPDMSAANVVNRLIATAKDQGAPGRDPLFGFGTVRPLEALTANVPPVSRNLLLGPEPSTNAAPRAAGGSPPSGGVPLVLWAVGVLFVLAFLVVAVVLIVWSRRRPATQGVPYGGGFPPGSGPPGYGAPPPSPYGAPPPTPYGAPPPYAAPPPASHGGPPSNPYGAPPPNPYPAPPAPPPDPPSSQDPWRSAPG